MSETDAVSMVSLSQHVLTLTEGIDMAAVDKTVASYDTIARECFVGHAEFSASMGLELVHLLKAVTVEKQFEPFPGGQGSSFMLTLDSFVSTADVGRFAFFCESFFEFDLDQGWVPEKGRVVDVCYCG